MKVIPVDEVPEQLRIHQHRKGTFRYRKLAQGQPGTPGNYLLEMVETTDDFFSPRHRHNFDQFRFQLDGTMNFDRNGKMGPGTFGYFPEGAAYGPQTSEGRSATAVLQFGGASGGGYLSRQEVEAGREELTKFGSFDGGVFRRRDDSEGRRSTDAYQAIWEYVHGRRMDYPKPRYRDPIMVDPANYEWLAVAGSPGVRQKPLGTFTERQCAAVLLKLSRGATYRAGARSVYLFLSGTGIAHDAEFRRWTALHLDAEETADIVARDEAEILRLVLPDLTGLEAQVSASTQAAAAE